MISKKHFTKLAQIVGKIKSSRLRQQITNELICWCIEQNPEFDTNKFINERN